MELAPSVTENLKEACTLLESFLSDLRSLSCEPFPGYSEKRLDCYRALGTIEAAIIIANINSYKN